MKAFLAFAVALALNLNFAAAAGLEDGFVSPPAPTKPWCYWYWISDNISKDGITRDLEAMSRVGIGEALIGNIHLPDDVPPGPVKALTPGWWDCVRHAMREGGRTGVNIGMFNCPGWSQSGGPWIKPEQAMRRVVSSETRVIGPRKFAEKLAAPAEHFQDIALLAFPAPLSDADSIAAKSPRVTCTPPVAGAEKICDGKIDAALDFPDEVIRSNRSFTVELALAAPFTARSLQLHPTDDAFSADCELQAAGADGNFQTVRRFKCERSNTSLAVNCIARGPVTISFPVMTAKTFRLVFANLTLGSREFKPCKTAALAEINLSGAARLESFVEKQLGKMHPTDKPTGDTYLWPTQAESDSAKLAVPVAAVRNLTAKLAADGTLNWDVPPGEWIILRTGMTPTGMKNSPASPEGQGLDVDKMNRVPLKFHFNSFIGEALKRIPAAERTAFKRVVADSYEMGSQNWTDGFDDVFRKRYGYDPKPWLPVLTGRLVGSADTSERFLWDLRRLIADRIATEYVGGLREDCHERGLGLWLENYGHWGFPGEFLKYGSESDRIGGEFWMPGGPWDTLGEIGLTECLAASSCVNTYGKNPIVSAEAFTGGPIFRSSPATLKARGDWAFCQGVNHFVLHVYMHQPWANQVPGLNVWFGTEFNRNNTWFEQSKVWIDYLRRSSWLLQQGSRVADVAYFIGEDAPKMTGTRQPALPMGRDFDFINAEVIEKNLSVKNGVLTLPHGVSYRVLVLPEQTTMRPAVMRKIRDLVKAGATVVGLPPSRSPSLENYPQCDDEVRKLAREVWGEASQGPSGEHQFGKGRVVWGKIEWKTSLEEVFASACVPADVEFRGAADGNFLFTHRANKAADIYFVSNQKGNAAKVECVFRVAGRQPELWDAVTGERRPLADWSVTTGRTLLPLEFAPNQSWFVVFQKPAAPREPRAPNFPATQAVAELTGSWEVSFAPGWGAPEMVTFDQLTDWTQRAEDGIKFFSGAATYRKTFELPDSKLETKNSKLLLDIGEVRDLATVRVNGRELATLWTAPWRMDITSAVKPGSNLLEVTVVNAWNNRLVGDAALPAAERRTFLTSQTVKADVPLLPAGLLGPVTLRSSR